VARPCRGIETLKQAEIALRQRRTDVAVWVSHYRTDAVANAGDGDACMACGEGGGGRVMLLCDGCDRACHLKCTVPRLRRTPAGDWFCAEWCALEPWLRALVDPGHCEVQVDRS